MSRPLGVAVPGPAPEPEIALDMARRALPVAPFVLAAAGLVWGMAGVASAGFAIAVVLANLVLSAAMLSRAARVSAAALMGTALFGYLLRLALVGLALWAVAGAGWVEPVALGVTLVGTHLGLLAWELRYVSASLAYPGLKPGRARGRRGAVTPAVTPQERGP